MNKKQWDKVNKIFLILKENIVDMVFLINCSSLKTFSKLNIAH